MYRPILLTVFVGSLLACQPERDQIEIRPYPIDDTQQQVVAGLATLEAAITTDWAAQTAKLLTAVGTLRTTPNDAHLLAAQTAWKQARGPWENNEGFGFGPVATDGIDASSDDWPFDRTSFDKLLTGQTVLNAALIPQLATSTKGFHAIEYLLFGPTGGRRAGELDPRSLQLLNLLAADLNTQATKLRTAWARGTGSFGDSFAGAGTPGSAYKNTAAALGEVIGAMGDILNELPGSKLETALAKQSTDYNESQFSDHSLIDYRNNVRGVYGVYIGSYGSITTARSISELVKAANPSLDDRIRTQFRLCMALLDLVPGTLNTAIFSQRPQLREVQTELTKLQALIATDVPVTLGL